MNIYEMKQKIKLFFLPGLILLAFSGCASQSGLTEHWIEYRKLSTLKTGMSQDEVIRILGEPLLILSDSDDEYTISLFYNYKVTSGKRVDKKQNQLTGIGARTTQLKFNFSEGKLVSWEEDNLALGLARRKSSSGGSITGYLGLLIDIVLLIGVFGK